ncbi:ABC transporter permease [Lactobacillus sp. CBA3606]|uniref:ABC transporter permease n=1 Tax=Lactobacillus sp. CBA3606 TaxID=2099789 RepID=UPI000CFAB5B9|nr:ABC transporter permease [Lactobacillus sp. CBA3606]AVK63599.1 ABC transporter permease [Lactobacillus sp. CBA3606]
MSTKTRAVTRHLLKEYTQTLGWSYAIVLIVLVVLPVLFSLLTGEISKYDFASNFANLNVGMIFGFVVFILYALTYDNFKLLIQNGISRKTYWQARLSSLTIFSLFGTLIAFIYNYGIAAPLLNTTLQSKLNSTYYQPYSHFFGTQLLWNLLGNTLFTWIFFIALGTFGMAIGSIFALLTKFVRRLCFVVIPILGVFLLGFISSVTVTHLNDRYAFDGFANFVKFLVGYHAKNGYFNPWMPMATMIIGSVITAAIAYCFNQQLKIKN